ncbi:hypothetical protein PC117_g847 [Phytophthora cactorum]|uniref:Uncharacterized protein n=1 Tax=Phytophthora cactorum TaxID=29920 RepID=A0A8T1ESH1_9STRA|nr:hypothetical protein PC117_g847 [Phytophthora cactorum]
MQIEKRGGQGARSQERNAAAEGEKRVPSERATHWTHYTYYGRQQHKTRHSQLQHGMGGFVP